MNNPWVSVIKVCSDGGATYIICKIIAKNNFDIVNLIQKPLKIFFSKSTEQNS